MKSEELKQLKAWILVGTLCFTLGACSEKKKEEVQYNSEKVVTQYKDGNSYLIVFIENKAVIYHSSEFAYSETDGYAILSKDYASMRFIQTPCVVLTGKDNCIKFASEIVGEDNVIFMNFENEYDLVLKSNN